MGGRHPLPYGLSGCRRRLVGLRPDVYGHTPTDAHPRSADDAARLFLQAQFRHRLPRSPRSCSLDTVPGWKRLQRQPSADALAWLDVARLRPGRRTNPVFRPQLPGRLCALAPSDDGRRPGAPAHGFGAVRVLCRFRPRAGYALAQHAWCITGTCSANTPLATF